MWQCWAVLGGWLPGMCVKTEISPPVAGAGWAVVPVPALVPGSGAAHASVPCQSYKHTHTITPHTDV